MKLRHLKYLIQEEIEKVKEQRLRSQQPMSNSQTTNKFPVLRQVPDFVNSADPRILSWICRALGYSEWCYGHECDAYSGGSGCI